MFNLKKKSSLKILIIFGLLLFVFLAGAPKKPAPHSILSGNNVEAAFSFMPKGGFYNEDIHVDLSSVFDTYPEADVRYTTDGTDPKEDSYQYVAPILLKNPDFLYAYTIKASVFDSTGKVVAGPFVSTYIMGNDIESDNDVIYVSITSDEEGLYSEDRGILYPMADCGDTAEDWSEFKRQNCKKRSEDIYDDSWIRKAHMQIFDSDENLVIDQGIGLCVDGDHGSMIHYPYSLKVLSNEIFDSFHPSFSYDFFKIYNKGATDFAHVMEYNNMVFRNGGNEYMPGAINGRRRGVLLADKGVVDSKKWDEDVLENSNGTMLRWAIGSRLADEAGFMCAGSRPALIFLNGELYGAASLLDTYNRYNTAEKTRLHKDSLEIWKDAERACTDKGKYEDLYYSYPEVEDTPIKDEGNQKEFESLVDVKEMFRYYAFEVLVNNTDFPKKNYAIWKGGLGDFPQTGSVYDDGKYRFLINDLDCTYDFRYDDDLWVAYFHNIKEDGTLMGSLMQVDKYRDMFINTLCDLMNTGLFDKDHMELVFKEAMADFEPAAKLAYPEHVEKRRRENIERMLSYALNRKDQVKGFLKETFSPQYPYTLKIKAPDEGAVISFSTTDITNTSGDFKGEYYGDYPMPLTFSKNDALKFKGWLINGNLFEGEMLTLSKDIIWDGKIEVELLTENSSTDPLKSLCISEIGYDENEAWAELYNAGGEDILLSEYYLANDEIHPIKKFRLPGVILKPGEVYVAGVDNTGRFKIEQDIKIYLLYKDNKSADEFRVPVVGKNESYGRFGETDTYKYYPTPSKGRAQ